MHVCARSSATSSRDSYLVRLDAQHGPETHGVGDGRLPIPPHDRAETRAVVGPRQSPIGPIPHASYCRYPGAYRGWASRTTTSAWGLMRIHVPTGSGRLSPTLEPFDGNKSRPAVPPLLAQVFTAARKRGVCGRYFGRGANPVGGRGKRPSAAHYIVMSISASTSYAWSPSSCSLAPMRQMAIFSGATSRMKTKST